jgi:predicted alpha-1,6-mannanase (GH76 family)
LITEKGIVIDGLPTDDCSVDAAPVGDYWTYNSDVLLDALCRNNQISLAINITKSAIEYYTRNNIILELSCGSTGYCSGLDGKVFKGALTRHLLYSVEYFPDDFKESINKFIIFQAESIILNSSLKVGDKLMLGQQWQGPAPEGECDIDQMVSQSSAFDAILASYQLT